MPREEVDRLVPVLRETMEGALPLDVPLTVDVKVGTDWESMTPVSRRDALLGRAPGRFPGMQSRAQLAGQSEAEKLSALQARSFSTSRRGTARA